MPLVNFDLQTGLCSSPRAFDRSPRTPYKEPVGSRPLSTLQGVLARPRRDDPVGLPFAVPFKDAYDDLQQRQELRFLEDIFRAADSDNSGQVNFKEFLSCFADPKIFKMLNRRFGLQQHQIPTIFRALDVDGSGDVSLDEWLETCKALMNAVQDGVHLDIWKVHDLRQLIKKHQDSQKHAASSAGKGLQSARRHHCTAPVASLVSPRLPPDARNSVANLGFSFGARPGSHS
mmetsp:Transcript_90756/g.245127  ORF Transcript_90756/g.245127 Transcript_90756/m.245127 type:complete len:231 (+) Transcript_90756:69-761(+)